MDFYHVIIVHYVSVMHVASGVFSYSFFDEKKMTSRFIMYCIIKLFMASIHFVFEILRGIFNT